MLTLVVGGSGYFYALCSHTPRYSDEEVVVQVSLEKDSWNKSKCIVLANRVDPKRIVVCDQCQTNSTFNLWYEFVFPNHGL